MKKINLYKDIISFLNNSHIKTPCLVVDLELVEESFKLLSSAFSGSDIFYAVKAKYPGYKAIATDACVPISKLADLIDETARDISRSGIPGPIWGHVGDGNFHATLLIRENSKEDRELAQGIIHRMCQRCLQMEGTITGEHGIGLQKKKLFIKRTPR